MRIAIRTSRRSPKRRVAVSHLFASAGEILVFGNADMSTPLKDVCPGEQPASSRISGRCASARTTLSVLVVAIVCASAQTTGRTKALIMLPAIRLVGERRYLL